MRISICAVHPCAGGHAGGAATAEGCASANPQLARAVGPPLLGVWGVLWEVLGRLLGAIYQF